VACVLLQQQLLLVAVANQPQRLIIDQDAAAYA
jgi:hypothetical protein